MIKRTNKQAASLIEILLVLAILSVAILPFVHIIGMSYPVDSHTDDEYMATLLAQHIMESIIAKRDKNPNFLPSVSELKPVVKANELSNNLSEYFSYFEEYKGPVTKSDEPQLYWSINKFKCKVDTYLLDSNIFKVVVYVIYQEDKREMKVYLERLFSQNNYIDEIDNDIEEDSNEDSKK